MKPGPIIAMVVLILLGMWLVLQPALGRPKGHLLTRVGAVQLWYDQRPEAGGSPVEGPFEYRFVNRPEIEDRWVSHAQYERVLAQEVAAWSARPALERTLLGFFNITSWVNFAWIVIGLAGQIAFFARMLVQWVVSEKARESVVPTLFWWLSLGGSVCLFAYFVWRVDFVGVLGQSTGIVIYIRNLRLIHKQRRRAARQASGQGPTGNSGATAGVGGDAPPDPAADPAPEPTGV